MEPLLPAFEEDIVSKFKVSKMGSFRVLRKVIRVEKGGRKGKGKEGFSDNQACQTGAEGGKTPCTSTPGVNNYGVDNAVHLAANHVDLAGNLFLVGFLHEPTCGRIP